MKKRIVVGLTGSFGSGKTTVNQIFRKLGARVINADQIVHEVFESRHPMAGKIKALFNAERISRKQIAWEIFNDPEKRQRLEALVHPYVKTRIQKELNKFVRGIVVLEIPLLFEAGFDRLCDKTVAVIAGRENIMKRLVKHGFSPEEISARLSAQWSEDEKKKRAGYAILNDGSKEKLRKEVQTIWTKLVQ